MTSIEEQVRQYALYAAEELNEAMGLAPGYDQTRGNRCDKLTFGVMQALQSQGLVLRRELHKDDAGNWHYLLAHEVPDATPTNADLISDLNPWQWRDYGGGILHAPREEVMARLRDEGAPAHFVALRSIATIAERHDTRPNPFR